MEIFRKKNEATIIVFPMVTAASPETFDTGETVTDTAYYSDAEGTLTSLAITDTVSEIGSTGMYELSLTASEMNHDLIIIKMTSGTAADSAIIIRTRAVDLDDLVRATTPANTLDVNAAGEAGIDLDNTSGTLTSADITSVAGAAVTSLGANVITAASINANALDNKGNWNVDKTGYALSAAGVDAIWDETMAGHVTADTVGLVINELQDGGRLDLLIDGIKAKTDDLTFTKANELDANVQSVNGVTLVGDGSGTPFNV